MGRPTGQRVAPVQRQTDPNEAVQRTPAGDAGSAGAVNLTPQGSGSPLPKQVSDPFVQSDYPEVKQARVHVDDAATQSIQAKAYTQKNNIVVQSSGANDPELLGHEATHVVQQSQMALKPDVNGTPINANPALEQNADDNGERVARHEPVSVEGARATGKPATREGAGSKLPVQRHGDGVVQRVIKGRPASNRSRKSAEQFLKQQDFTQAVAEAVVDAAIKDQNLVTYADMIRAARLMVQRQLSAAQALVAAMVPAPPAAPAITQDNNPHPNPYNAPVVPLNNVQGPVDFGAAQIDFAAPVLNNHNPILNAPVVPLNNVQGPVDFGAAQIGVGKQELSMQFPGKKTALSPDEWTQYGQPIEFGQAQIKGLESDEKVENDSPMKPLAYPNKQADLPTNQKYLKDYFTPNKYFEIKNEEIPDYFRALYNVHPNPEYLNMTSKKLLELNRWYKNKSLSPTFWASAYDTETGFDVAEGEPGHLMPCTTEKGHTKTTQEVYRGDTRPPSDKSITDAIKPWSALNKTKYSGNLVRHTNRTPSPDDSDYISTTSSGAIAKKYAEKSYLYDLGKKTGIDVNTNINARHPEEKEFSIVGSIPLSEIKAVESMVTGRVIQQKHLKEIVKRGWSTPLKDIWPECKDEKVTDKTTWKDYLDQPKVEPHLGKDEHEKLENAKGLGSEKAKAMRVIWPILETIQVGQKYGRNIVSKVFAHALDTMPGHNRTPDNVEKYRKITAEMAQKNYGMTEKEVLEIYELCGLNVGFDLLVLTKQEFQKLLKEETNINPEQPISRDKAKAELAKVTEDAKVIVIDGKVIDLRSDGDEKHEEYHYEEKLFEFLISQSVIRAKTPEQEAEEKRQKRQMEIQQKQTKLVDKIGCDISVVEEIIEFIRQEKNNGRATATIKINVKNNFNNYSLKTGHVFDLLKLFKLINEQ